MRYSLATILLKTMVTHTVTYFITGLLASTLLDYGTWFALSELNQLMRPFDDPWVMAGPILQPIRGLLFGGVFYLLREVIFDKNKGWVILWATLLGIGIVGTFGPTPGSLEGLIYTTLPLDLQLRGLPEVVLQSLLLSLVLVYWLHHPEKRWLTWTMGIAFVVGMLLPILGLLLGPS